MAGPAVGAATGSVVGPVVGPAVDTAVGPAVGPATPAAGAAAAPAAGAAAGPAAGFSPRIGRKPPDGEGLYKAASLWRLSAGTVKPVSCMPSGAKTCSRKKSPKCMPEATSMTRARTSVLTP